MQKNDTAVIEITDIGAGGEGIGKADGYTLFVKDAVIGDKAEVKVIKARKITAMQGSCRCSSRPRTGWSKMQVCASVRRVSNPECPMTDNLYSRSRKSGAIWNASAVLRRS